MLGNLQADMSRQGVNTTQKGCCNACDKPIVGQVFFLSTWHELNGMLHLQIVKHIQFKGFN
jgi:hypothetical protein